MFTILFWPYLWENPLNNFTQIFMNLSSFDWEGYNFYFGDYHEGKNMPWHYILVWIGILTRKDAKPIGIHIDLNNSLFSTF